MSNSFSSLLTKIEETYAQSPYIKALFGAPFLNKLSQEGDDVLLHWFVRALIYGPGVDRLEAGLKKIMAKDLKFQEMLQEKVKVLVSHKDWQFRTQLSSLLAEIRAIEYFLFESKIEIACLTILNEQKLSKVGPSPDFLIKKVGGEEVYAEVKFIEGSSDIETQFQNHLLKEALINPEGFGYEFTVQPRINAYQVGSHLSSKFVRYCISQLAERNDILGAFNLENAAFPDMSARIEIREGHGVSAFHGAKGGGGTSASAGDELLLLGHLYSSIIRKIHEAFVQLTEFHEGTRKGRAWDDWIYLKIDTKSLTRLLFHDTYPKTIVRLTRALKLSECVNVVIDRKRFVRQKLKGSGSR
jgi:hypothetical protein